MHEAHVRVDAEPSFLDVAECIPAGQSQTICTVLHVELFRGFDDALRFYLISIFFQMQCGERAYFALIPHVVARLPIPLLRTVPQHNFPLSRLSELNLVRMVGIQSVRLAAEIHTVPASSCLETHCAKEPTYSHCALPRRVWQVAFNNQSSGGPHCQKKT